MIWHSSEALRQYLRPQGKDSWPKSLHGIGAFLPSAGVGFYVACAIMGTDIETAARAMLPYLVVLIIALLIVAFVPWFTVFLPRALGLGG